MSIFRRLKNQRGFSLIEILMALILIAVLAAIGINAFINFRTEARDAALRADLKVIRSGIAAQYGQAQLRCNGTPGTFPPAASVIANDITSGVGALCTVGQVTVASERQFVANAFPIPPFGTVGTPIGCGGLGNCTRGDGVACNTAATFSNQWCYNNSTGEVWLDNNLTDAGGTRYDAY